MRRFAFIFLALFLFGCGQGRETILGKAPQGTPITISSIQSKDSAATVTLHGKMVEKCPVAGCWFNLRDDTGLIKVDTKGANFVVLNVPLQTEVIVSGRVSTNGSEKMIEATGISYR